jgi:hypothetical protein
LGDKYWQKRDLMVALLDWLSRLANAEPMIAWSADSVAARLLAGRLRNDTPT